MTGQGRDPQDVGLAARFRAIPRNKGIAIAHNVKLPVWCQRADAITAKEIASSHAAVRIIWPFCGDLSMPSIVSDFAASRQ
jgi:hypothetical protein